VAVRILETVLIHKAVVLRLGILRAASRNSFGDELLDFSPTLATKAEQHFRGLRTIADGLRSELAEFRVSQSHHVYRITEDDAGCGIVRELGIMGVAETLEEGKGTREVGDREVDEDFGVL